VNQQRTKFAHSTIVSVLVACTALAGIIPVTSRADTERSTAETKADSLALDEIVVTAQKRQENIQDVPIAVTALTSEMISNLHPNTLFDLNSTVPSFQIDHHSNAPNSAVLYIRGMGIEEADPYAGNTVSVVLDGVPQFFNMGSLVSLFDVDRIEILRGPQGTLFGANTTGGVVNVITRQPTGQFDGEMEATYGNWNRIDAKGYVDFPISDSLSGKVDFVHTQRTGWITNVVTGTSMGGINEDGGRVYLKFKPNEDFDSTLIGEVYVSRDGAPVVVNGAIPGEALYVAPGTMVPGSALPMYASPCAPNQPCRAPSAYYSANDSTPDESDMNTYWATLNTNWRNTPIGDLTSITGFKKFNLLEYTDQDGTPEFLLDTRRHTVGQQLSEELRTAAKLSDSANMIAGLFYMKTHYDHLAELRAQYALPGFSQDSVQAQNNYSASAFAQSYFNITDKLQLQAGVRYEHTVTEMNAASLNYLSPTGVAQFSGSPYIGGFNEYASKNWNNVGGKLGLDYKLDAQKLIYGSVTRGFKDGGFVGRVGIPTDIGPYNPEIAYTYEIGGKADWLERRLRTNVAVFYTDYRNMQLAQNYFAPSTGGSFVQGNTILNAARAKIKGVEFDGSMLVATGLTLSSSAAFLDAKYSKFPFTVINALGSNVINLAGYELQNSPRWSATAGAKYEFSVGPGMVAWNVLYTYTGQKYLDALNDTPRSSIQPTNYVNMNLDYQPNHGNWSVSAWARNLMDKRYVDNVFDAPGTFAFVSYAPPREYGITAKYHF
jgi:iron complex outermembrane recepter protein